jgi:hypothetical protein
MGSATIQADFREDHYPIGRFILGRARALGMSRSDLVHRLGYPDIGNGQEALSAALVSGSVTPQMANRLAGVLEADDALIASVIDATLRQR